MCYVSMLLGVVPVDSWTTQPCIYGMVQYSLGMAPMEFADDQTKNTESWRKTQQQYFYKIH